MRQRLGQHFLIKGGILDRIASASCPEREPLVIEIGAGKGALTGRLLGLADRVVAIELDPDLAARLREKHRGEAGLEVISADALEIDLAQWGPAVIAGNLPYYVATPILERAVAPDSRLIRGVFLIQREVAERVTALPGTRAYGFLTVQIQLFSDAEMLFGVPPGAFHPPPKVDSAVVRLRPRDRAGELGIDNARRFLEFVGRCFKQKRKTIRNNLSGVFGRERLDPLPEAPLRAEQLPIEQLAALYRRLTSVSR